MLFEYAGSFITSVDQDQRNKMSSFPCKYHPDRIAVTKCEKCNNFICLECKNTYHVTHSGHHSSYAITYELCPICYAEKVKASTNPICFILPLIFVVFFMIMAGSMFSRANSWEMGPPVGFQAMFFIVPIIMLGIFGYFCTIRGSQMRQEAEKKKVEAMRGYQSSSQPEMYVNRNEATLDPTMKSKQIYCHQCGNLLEPKEKFCSNCGNTTFDEFHQ